MPIGDGAELIGSEENIIFREFLTRQSGPHTEQPLKLKGALVPKP
jgi:hypothetical protein